MKSSIILLRILHTAFAIYFIFCIFYIYYSALILQINILLGISVISLAIEGFLFYIVNNGNCPLVYLQKKLKDPVPFLNLFLPEPLAKKAIPFSTAVTFLGMLFLIIRLLLK